MAVMCSVRCLLCVASISQPQLQPPLRSKVKSPCSSHALTCNVYDCVLPKFEILFSIKIIHPIRSGIGNDVRKIGLAVECLVGFTSSKQSLEQHCPLECAASARASDHLPHSLNDSSLQHSRSTASSQWPPKSPTPAVRIRRHRTLPASTLT